MQKRQLRTMTNSTKIPLTILAHTTELPPYIVDVETRIQQHAVNSTPGRTHITHYSHVCGDYQTNCFIGSTVCGHTRIEQRQYYANGVFTYNLSPVLSLVNCDRCLNAPALPLLLLNATEL